MHYPCLVSWSWKMMTGLRQKKPCGLLVMQLMGRIHILLFLWCVYCSLCTLLISKCIPRNFFLLAYASCDKKLHVIILSVSISIPVVYIIPLIIHYHFHLICLLHIWKGNWNYFAAIRNEKRNPKLEATHLEKAKELYTRVQFSDFSCLVRVLPSMMLYQFLTPSLPVQYFALLFSLNFITSFALQLFYVGGLWFGKFY